MARRVCSSTSQLPGGALPSSAASPEPACPVFASPSGAERSPPSTGCKSPGGLTGIQSPVMTLTRLPLLQDGRRVPLAAPDGTSGPPSQDLNLVMDNWPL